MSRLLCVSVFLLTAGVVAGQAPPAVPVPSKPVRVALFNGNGASKSGGAALEAVRSFPRFSVDLVSAADIRAGGLKGYDLVIFPGGSGGKQGADLGPQGREQVQAFVRGGGGYIGICAGAYLASRSYSWSLHILDAEVLDREHWARGTGEVILDVRKPAKSLLNKSDVAIYYGQGPLLAPGKDDAIPDYEELAAYRTEIHSRGGAKPGVMKGTTAVARGVYGDGRVMCFSPHPEKSSDETKEMLHKALLWAAGR